MAVPSHPGLVGMTAARLAVEATVHETSGAKSARDKLDAILARGEPVIAFVDQQSIGTWVQPSTLSGYWGYQAVVAGRLDDGTYLVDDRGRTPQWAGQDSARPLQPGGRPATCGKTSPTRPYPLTSWERPRR
ncbi:MAG TPA: hypothetical protein VGP30_00545 [Candidatus Limnocylindrales bacterium]|nr:hypothetical protein [Candidatus Limnocylindrales bacterium]